MTNTKDYSEDREFSRLIRREDRIDLQRLSLEMARDEYPELDLERLLSWFDQVAAEIKPKIRVTFSVIESLLVMIEHLAGERSLYGTSAAFRDPRCSYLNRVIETGRGLPITLSLVYMGVAERLGLELKGVALPLHFVCRMDTSRGPLFIDAFTNGNILTEKQCVEWLKRTCDLSEDVIQRSLGPAEPRTIVLRMLNNLKVMYAQQEAWKSLWNVQNRLCALQAGDWQERRDLGMVSVQANRPGLAVELLTDCLKSCQNETDQHAMEHALQRAQSLLTTMN
jgi:regulator of sirC expression with transglutaminase-like and TPR domain